MVELCFSWHQSWKLIFVNQNKFGMKVNGSSPPRTQVRLMLSWGAGGIIKTTGAQQRLVSIRNKFIGLWLPVRESDHQELLLLCSSFLCVYYNFFWNTHLRIRIRGMQTRQEESKQTTLTYMFMTSLIHMEEETSEEERTSTFLFAWHDHHLQKKQVPKPHAHTLAHPNTQGDYFPLKSHPQLKVQCQVYVLCFPTCCLLLLHLLRFENLSLPF